MTSGIMEQDPIIVGHTQIRWFLERSSEIYPGTATEPVGGTGSKATGLEASRSRGMCSCDTMDKIVREGRPNSAILQQVCLSMPEHDKLVQLDGEMFFPLHNYNFFELIVLPKNNLAHSRGTTQLDEIFQLPPKIKRPNLHIVRYTCQCKQYQSHR